MKGFVFSGGNVQVDQLTGVTACQRDDVQRKEWQGKSTI